MSKKNSNRPEDFGHNGQLLDNPDNRPHDSAKRTKNQSIEDWLTASYDFRFNTIKQKPEWKEKNEITYVPLDKFKLLSIKRELDAVGYSISKDSLLDILCSDYSEPINPVKDYFRKLKFLPGKDYIAELAATVKCKNADKWPEYLKKWLIGVVANVFIDERCANHVMLVLTGTQGKFKTTWLENLCPKQLRPYLFTGKINLESKDTLTLIAENLFVNIDDQLKQLNKKDENELKNLITINHVKYRRPYDPIITDYPHLCSFMASVNGNEFLTDPTGSRRFLPFEVSEIFIKEAQKLDLNNVWAQAYKLFNESFRYWFDDEEIDELNKRNEEFSVVSIEQQFLSFYFSNKPEPGSLSPMLFLPNAEILSRISKKTNNHKLSEKKLGEALNKLGFKKCQNKYKHWGYNVYEKTEDQIYNQTKVPEIQQESIL